MNGKRVNGKGSNKNGKVILKIERNGKGKEFFYNGKLKFEEDHFYGRKFNGKGYDLEGKEIFEIKYGNGHLKEYNKIGNLLFECKYI